MKKTVSINLAGLIFNVEEDGYELLKNYLEEIKAIFSSEEGVSEMLEDIEARIAELFHAKLNVSKQVITESDVSSIMEIMGKPTDYKVDTEEGESETGKTYTTDEPFNDKGNKRLYRDEDNAAVGGVCAGLGHYFDIDPVIIRVLFVLMVILGGSGILVYLILWIVVPEAKTTAQKLQMRGQPVNLDNIKDYVNNFTKEAKTSASKAASSIKKTVNKSGSVIGSIFKVFGKIIGIGFLIGGIIAIIVLSTVFFGDSNLVSFTSGTLNNNLKTFFEVLYPTGTGSLSIWSLYIIVILPILLLISLGLKLVFNYKAKMKVPNIGGLILWIVAVCVLSYTSIGLGLEHKSSYEVTDEIEKSTSDTTEVLHIGVHYNGLNMITNGGNDYWDENDYFFIGKDRIEMGVPRIKVVRDSTLQDYKIILKRRSEGKNVRQALTNAKGIAFNPVYKGDSLIIPNVYSFSTDDKIRGQQVTVEINVPIGKSITLPRSKNGLIYEIYRNKGVGHYFKDQTNWISTKEGMRCENC